jgi:F-type H+-transporting ATPase subunit O
MMSARVARSGLRAAQQFSAPRAAVNSLRTYATPAQDASVNPPVALFGVSGTYASALVCLRLPYVIRFS